MPRARARSQILSKHKFDLCCSVFFFLFPVRSFPICQTGAVLVTRFKHNLARNGHPFRTSHGLKVMAFGHSVMLAGFIPSLFDSQMAAAGISHVESYNFGLPGDGLFVGDLETMIARGVGPDLVLLIVPWPAGEKREQTIFHFMNDDSALIDTLFPFRNLPRDLFVMMVEAGGRPAAFRRTYLQSERTIGKLEADRGYYFITRQSHYANYELPDDFRSPTDTPDVMMQRVVSRGPIFDQLGAICPPRTGSCACLFPLMSVKENLLPLFPEVRTPRVPWQITLTLAWSVQTIFCTRTVSSPIRRTRTNLALKFTPVESASSQTGSGVTISSS